MEFIITAVGTRMPNWVDEAFAEYQKRMPREARIRLMEIKPEKRDGGKSAQQVMTAEAERIAAALPKGALIIALDEHGKQFTSQALAPAHRGALTTVAQVRRRLEDHSRWSRSARGCATPA